MNAVTQNQAITIDDIFHDQEKLVGLANLKYDMPVSGPCETKHGEMLRAVNKIIYRFLNDGDSMFVGYGCETCGPAASWLINEFPSQFAEPIKKGLDNLLTDSCQGYLDLLHELALKALGIIQNQADEPRGKEVYDYDQEWENQKCQACECYFPADDLESDGMGGSFCSCCYDHRGGEDE